MVEYAAGAAPHPVVRLAITPTPAHVRTARLVASAAAREFGADASLLEEIKLAVSEACTRAISASQYCDKPGLVTLSISRSGAGEAARITLVVADRGRNHRLEPGSASGSEPMITADSDAADASALLTSMIDDVEIGPAPDGIGTVVRASWPTRAAGQPRL
ncbi:MAG: ATP-binding protein [Mycobacteriales bacterium]